MRLYPLGFGVKSGADEQPASKVSATTTKGSFFRNDTT